MVFSMAFCRGFGASLPGCGPRTGSMSSSSACSCDPASRFWRRIRASSVRDDCTPGHEWLKFTRRIEPTDRLWTSLEDEQSVTPLIAQPGGNNLGLGRHFHFFSVVFWVLNGVIYVILLFATGEWRGSSHLVVYLPRRAAYLHRIHHLPPTARERISPLRSAAAAFLCGGRLSARPISHRDWRGAVAGHRGAIPLVS